MEGTPRSERSKDLGAQMKRCLITGMGGFLGSYLAQFLCGEGLTVAGTVHEESSHPLPIPDLANAFPCDILDGEQVAKAVDETRPGVLFHFAARSLPQRSWEDPETTFRVNIIGVVNVLEAVRRAGRDPIVVIAGSSAEYGAVAPEQLPISEDGLIHPTSPYGASKAAADVLTRFYAAAYGIKAIRIRPFQAIGPRKMGDMCSDFARGIVAVERGLEPVLRVGNLEAVRDFLDVRDVVGGAWLIAEEGLPGQAYNICSGVGHSGQDVLNILLSHSSRAVPVERDPARLRPGDQPMVVGDNSRLRALGWEQTVPLEQSLISILEYWRETDDGQIAVAREASAAARKDAR